MDDLREEQLNSELVFDGALLKVYRDRVRLPDGREGVREYIRHPGACVIIPEIRPGWLLFERQFRYPLLREFIEFPAGKLDSQEGALACAQRELLEETGFRARAWKHLGTMHLCIGYSDERIEIFFAQGLDYIGRALDEGEFLDVLEMSLADAERAVLEGRITDAKTIVAIFWAMQT